MKIRITDEHNYGDKKVVLYNTEEPNNEARLALSFLERWGPVMAVVDGEDSAGRSKLRNMTPAEIASRAFEIAAATMSEVRQRGLMIQLPDLNEINAEHDATRGAKEEAAAEQALDRLKRRSEERDTAKR